MCACVEHNNKIELGRSGMRRVIDWPWREDRENKLPIKQFFFNFLHMINRGFKKEEKILVVVVVVLLVLINIFFFPFFFSQILRRSPRLRDRQTRSLNKSRRIKQRGRFTLMPKKERTFPLLLRNSLFFSSYAQVFIITR